MPEDSAQRPASEAWAGRDEAYHSGERTGPEAGYEAGPEGGFRPRSQHNKPARPMPPKGYKRSDERILEDVCERLSRSGLDIRNVSVSVKDGYVSLGGEVTDRHMKHAVEDVAASCGGVDDVDNGLKVVPGATGRSISSYGSDA